MSPTDPKPQLADLRSLLALITEGTGPGASLFDLFNRHGFTLLVTRGGAEAAACVADAARQRGLPLDIEAPVAEGLHALYQRSYTRARARGNHRVRGGRRGGIWRHGRKASRGGLLGRAGQRGVADLVSVPAPWGVSVELVHGLAKATTPFHSDALPNGIVTQDQGFGHVVFLTGTEKAYAEARRFAMEGLGLRQSDTLNMPVGPDVSLRVTFLHCNARHHSLAIGCAPMPEGAPPLHHINFEVASVRDVGTAYERALRAGTPIANTIGQHANDRWMEIEFFPPCTVRIHTGALDADTGFKEGRRDGGMAVWGWNSQIGYIQNTVIAEPEGLPYSSRTISG